MLKDNFGRHFTYLRLSVTEACNFRCSYCLPNGFTPPKEGLNELSLAELKNLLTAFIELGIKKVRITGGEPCLRKDVEDIIAHIKSFPQIERIALTSNGTALDKKLAAYVKAGLTALNLSVDSLKRNNFKNLTGHDKLPQILDVIAQAQKLPLEAIKLNAVLMKDVNDSELPAFLALLKNNPITMRFIELQHPLKPFLQYHSLRITSPLSSSSSSHYKHMHNFHHYHYSTSTKPALLKVNNTRKYYVRILYNVQTPTQTT